MLHLNSMSCLFVERQTGFAHKWQQYKAMLNKRFLNSKRDKKAVLTQLLLPCVLVLIGLITVINLDSNRKEPPRLLKLSNLSIGGVNTKAFYSYFGNASASTKASYLAVNAFYVLHKMVVTSWSFLHTPLHHNDFFFTDSKRLPLNCQGRHF